MITETDIRHYLFRPGSDKKVSGSDPDVAERTSNGDSGNGEVFLCRQCLAVITSTSQKTEINGSHRHSFANPHGMFFEIGCFRHAPGCVYSSDASYEFTWFKGFNWRIAVCRGCLNHLGWLFTSASHSFSGLILENLILSERSEKQ